MDAMTIKIDAQYKELQSHAKQPTPDLDDDDIPMSREEKTKFMQTFRKTRFYYNHYRDRDSNRDNWCSSGSDLGSSINLMPYSLYAKLSLETLKPTQNESIYEILEEDFDDLLDEGSKILHSIEGTVLEEEIFSKFDKFIAMVSNENYDSEFDEEKPKF
ncbi:hypothetical protein Tco_1541872 [Tanacetum coccineum]